MAVPRPLPTALPVESAERRDAVEARHLREIAGRAQAPVSAGQRLLPVHPALEPLLPRAGLQRGSVVAVSASTSLALALISTASAGGSWCAAVGLPSLGLLAAAELGIALGRFPLVASPSAGPERQTRPSGPERQTSWVWVVAALLDAFDVVLACPGTTRVRPADARRLAARARERGSVLVVTLGPSGPPSGVAAHWPEGADVRLEMVASRWEGVGRGHGRLTGRRVEVVAGGRGAAARERRVALWLPHPDGGVVACEPRGGPATGR